MKNIALILAVALISFGLGWFLKAEVQFGSGIQYGDGYKILSGRKCRHEGKAVSLTVPPSKYVRGDHSRYETIYYRRYGSDATLEIVNEAHHDDEVQSEAEKYQLVYDKSWRVENCVKTIKYQPGRP